MLTSFFWPILWALSKHCHSAAGFQAGSSSRMWFAAVRFNPTPPAFKDKSRTFGELAVCFWNRVTTSVRSMWDIVPSRRTNLKPFSVRRGWNMDRKLVNWETTIILSSGSASRIRSISFIAALTLLLLSLNSILSNFFRISSFSAYENTELL